VTKSRKIRWAGHIARTGAVRNSYRSVFIEREGRKHYRDIGVDGKIILKWIFKI
jgi:hypothetical protein